jgi:uroporphyrin-III C-methyltransferase
LTLRAARLIHEADDLVVDALVPAALWAGAAARVYEVGKRCGRPHVAQEEIERLLVELAQGGRHVVRLKGGDPGVFGHLAEETAALAAAGIPFTVVPGISSALAAPATLALPLTARRVADRIVIVSGHGPSGAPSPELPAFDATQTLVVLMGLGRLPKLLEALLARGYPPGLPAVVVSDATLATERHVAAPLGELAAATAAAGLGSPAVIVVGEVARELLGELEPALAAMAP